MATSVLTITTPHPLEFPPDATTPHATINHQARQLEAFVSGTLGGGGTVWLSYDSSSTAAKASETLTFTSVAAGNVLMVNGVRFYAVSGTPLRSAGEFKRGVSDTADAADFVTTFNAQTDARISGVLTASSALGVVTLTAQNPGVQGNAFEVRLLGIVAAGTVTYSSSSGAQTVVVNGVTVYNATGASDAANATAAAAAIVASADALVAKHVTAYANAGVCYIYALYEGTRGNAITLTATGTGATASGSGFLAGGTLAQSEGAQASGTVTCASVSAADTVTVNGVVFTAVAGTPAANQFDQSGTDTQDGQSLADAINKSTSAGVQDVVATNAAGAVTVKARRGGISGNVITLSSSNGTRLAVSGARLTGGAVPTQIVMGGSAVYRTGQSTALGGGAGGGAAPISFTR